MQREVQLLSVNPEARILSKALDYMDPYHCIRWQDHITFSVATCNDREFEVDV